MYLLWGLAGGECFAGSQRKSIANLSDRSGKNSGAVVEKNISFFDATSCSLGIDIVCTRLPLTINLISMESEVNAMTYGKAQTANGKQT